MHEYAVPYTRVTRIPSLHRVRYYLNNYIIMYNCLTRFRIRGELASIDYLRLGII